MRRRYVWHDQEAAEKSVCHELHHQDLLSTKNWHIDLAHFHKNLSTKQRQGYTVWAKPITRLIKRNRPVKLGIAYLANSRIEHIKYQLGIRQTPHWIGFLVVTLLFHPASLLCSHFFYQPVFTPTLSSEGQIKQ